jgi:hypothetical protein
MPYTNDVINPNKPADTDLASLGDDEIRQLKLDLKERLESFFESIDGDPLVAKDGAISFPEAMENLAVGLAVDRPEKPGDGRNAYYSVDTKILSLSNGAANPDNLAWVDYNMASIGVVAVVPQYVRGAVYNFTAVSPAIKMSEVTQARLVTVKIVNASTQVPGVFKIPLADFLARGLDFTGGFNDFQVTVLPDPAVPVASRATYDAGAQELHILITKLTAGGSELYDGDFSGSLLFTVAL